ncbi:unnamed protein product, partial [Prorocentrum cordatum]
GAAPRDLALRGRPQPKGEEEGGLVGDSRAGQGKRAGGPQARDGLRCRARGARWWGGAGDAAPTAAVVPAAHGARGAPLPRAVLLVSRQRGPARRGLPGRGRAKRRLPPRREFLHDHRGGSGSIPSSRFRPRKK